MFENAPVDWGSDDAIKYDLVCGHPIFEKAKKVLENLHKNSYLILKVPNEKFLKYNIDKYKYSYKVVHRNSISNDLPI